MENLINWSENNLFGLNYSTKLGDYKDFRFDIRYDYDGDPNHKPNCGVWLLISFTGIRIKSIGCPKIEIATESAEDYLQTFLHKYREK